MARKYNLTDTKPDTEKVCKALVKKYDQKINAAIVISRLISIEEMLEAPALIAHELFENSMITEESRRLV